MIWNIVVDSSCDLEKLHYLDEKNEVRYSLVPFILSIKGKDYVDDNKIVISRMLDDMESTKEKSRTSCPAPGAWLEQFEKEGNVIAVTISKELSGSYNSAVAAKEMLLESQPDKKIEIINSISAGPGLILLVQNILKGIRKNKSFEEVVADAHKVNEEKQTIFALCSFKNLVNNGRMSPLVGFVAQKLNFWGVGVASKIGTIEIQAKVRGSKKVLETIIKDIRDKKTEIRRVVISHCENIELAEKLKSELMKIFQNVTIEIYETKGLCSFYAERHGLIVAYR